MKLTEQNTILDVTDTEDLDTPNPIRSVTSKLIATQLNFISKTYRFEYNEYVRLNNLSNVRNRFDDSEEYIPVCKKIDQHLEKQPHSLYIDPEIIKFASGSHEYEELSPEVKMRLCIARIQLLHLELQMDRNNMLKAKSEVPIKKIRDILCGICLEELHPSFATIALNCGHVFCGTCLVKDSEKNVCVLCTAPKNQAEFTTLFLRFNMDYDPICRFCLIPFTDDVEIVVLKCGHVYCENCIHKLDGVCFCGRCLKAFNTCNTLYPRFN